MREKIIDVLKNSEPIFYDTMQINDMLGLTTPTEYLEVQKVLDEMTKDATLYKSKKDKYSLFENCHLLKGKLIVNKDGFGFVDIDGPKDVYIDRNNLNGSVNGDLVTLEMINDRNEGRIIKVINRDTKNWTGEFYIRNGKSYVHPLKKKGVDILIPDDKVNGAIEGNYVLVKPNGDVSINNYIGEVVEIICHKDDIVRDENDDIGMELILRENGFSPKFSSECESEAISINVPVSEEEIQKRKDLRDKIIVTIDGADTKDIDDAISYEDLPNGNTLVGVHIADVSNYVKENSIIDQEAYERGTSVYLTDRSIPMLPRPLSNGICSLNPNEERLALSCIMEVNFRGEIIDYEIVETVIKSSKKMTYDKVNNLLDNEVYDEDYEPFVSILNNLNRIAKIRRKRRMNNGAIEFNNPEAKIIVDEHNVPIDIKKRIQGTGEKLIEELMLMANETTTLAAISKASPYIYRVHGDPNKDKLMKLINFLKLKGYNIKKLNDYNRQFQNIVEEINKKPNAEIFNQLVIRTQAKAIYSNENIGHFGLATPNYCHFTSPIRRYPDLMVHRILKSLIINVPSTSDVSKYATTVARIAAHCSEKERDADNCERDADKRKKAEYMELNFIGKDFTGVISGVQQYGIFVVLPNTVEGLIKIEDLPRDRYDYDPDNEVLYGVSSGRKFMYGDVLKVQVIAASKETSTVDFKLIEEKKVVKNGNNKFKSLKKDSKKKNRY